MKKFSVIFKIIFSLGVFLIPTGFAFAQTNDNSITNYTPGTCVVHEGAQWQQLADGTWAPPGDSLNTCATGMPSNWLDNPQYNSWLKSGVDYNFPYLQQTGYSPWGTNYPTGTSSLQEYIVNCVIAQSIVARPECQTFPRLGNFFPNGDLSTNKNDLTSILKNLALGWFLGRILS